MLQISRIKINFRSKTIFFKFSWNGVENLEPWKNIRSQMRKNVKRNYEKMGQNVQWVLGKKKKKEEREAYLSRLKTLKRSEKWRNKANKSSTAATYSPLPCTFTSTRVYLSSRCTASSKQEQKIIHSDHSYIVIEIMAFPAQKQDSQPGKEYLMHPTPQHVLKDYKPSNKLRVIFR